MLNILEITMKLMEMRIEKLDCMSASVPELVALMTLLNTTHGEITIYGFQYDYLYTLCNEFEAEYIFEYRVMCLARDFGHIL